MKFTVTMTVSIDAVDAEDATTEVQKLIPHGDIQAVEADEPNPRERGDDDGVEYGDPRDEMEERLLRD